MKTMRHFHITLGMLAAIGVALSLAGCTTNVATGNSQLDYLSREDEIAIGRQAMPELIQQYGGLVPDARLQDHVRRVGMRLADHVEQPYQDMPWEFTFLDTNVINAFALPGGKVFMTRGLAERMTDESQLAGVLGHEIGHVTAEHADAAIGRQLGLQIGAGLLSVFAGASESAAVATAADVLVQGAGVWVLQYDREQENEADKLGMRYMARAGYNPEGQLHVMEILKEASGGQAPPEWLSTHPAPQTRIDIIRKRLQEPRWAALVEANRASDNPRAFQRDFIEPLKRLPPPKDTGQGGLLAHPELWCAHCRAARESGT